MNENHQLKRSEPTLTPREAVNIINSTRNFRDRCIGKCLYYAGMRVQEVD
jgi:integrase